MKIKIIKFYSFFFAIILLLEVYVSSFKINISVQFLSLIILFAIEKQKISKQFLNIITPIFIIFFICFIGMIFHEYKIFNIIKDISHFIKPLLGLSIGYFFYRKINNFKLFIKTIVITAFISSIIHFTIIISLKNIATVSDIREFTRDNFVELFGLLFFVFYKKFQKERLFSSKMVSSTILICLLISCILYFSRTMIIITAVVLLTLYGYTIVTKRTIKFGFAIVAFVLLFYTFLFSINIQRNKTGVESFLFKVKNAPAEIFKTHVDREKHEDLWDHWRGYEAERGFELLKENPEGFVFGLGSGSLVNLKFYAPLSGDKKGMKFISELHNGYMYVLYKTGVIGLFLYLFFLYQLYVKIYYSKDYISLFISAIGLSIFISSLVIGSMFNGNPTIIFILGGLLFFNERKIKASQNE